METYNLNQIVKVKFTDRELNRNIKYIPGIKFLGIVWSKPCYEFGFHNWNGSVSKRYDKVSDVSGIML